MTLNVTLPDSLYKKAMEVALREQISVERVVYSALAEQLNALERLEERAARSSEDRFRAALAKIPDVEPPEYDRLS
jgi:flagellar motor switch protein FliM